MKVFIATIFLATLLSNVVLAEQLNTDRSKKPKKVPSIFTEFTVNTPVKKEAKSLEVKALEERLKIAERELAAKKLEESKPTLMQTEGVDARYPMIRADGTFHSPRFLDYRQEAAKLYKVSGSAIADYQKKSMFLRNQLERGLDLEHTNWEIRKNFYLQGPPWRHK